MTPRDSAVHFTSAISSAFAERRKKEETEVKEVVIETKPKIRLLVGSMSSLLAIYLSKYWLNNVDFPFFDYFLQISIFGIFFTVFASVGMINAINFIDGIHGLAAWYSLILLISLLFLINFDTSEITFYVILSIIDL